MRKLLMTLLTASLLFGQSQILSPIPLPMTIIIDLDPNEYEDHTLEKQLEDGKVFTFIAKSKNSKNEELLTMRQNIMSLFNIMEKIYASGTFRLAFIVPYKVIGKYASSTSNSALGYLLNRGIPFEMKLYTIEDEDEQSLLEILNDINKEKFDLVVAPVTQKGAYYLCNQTLYSPLFIPTLHKNRLDCSNSMIFFGGIDYTKQIEILSSLVNEDGLKITVSDNSPVSQMLSDTAKEIVPIDENIVLGQNGYYKRTISRFSDLNQSTIFLNTPIVKSSLFLSQLTLANFKPSKVLSTQINYSPLLLTLTQYHDRENMVIANSIEKIDPKLSENIALIEQDIRFNWLNYSTVAGIDIVFSEKTSESRLSTVKLVNGSLNHNVELYEAGLYRFILKEPLEY
ncbi:hypothetical protein RZR97_07710 [Hydrogenimonas thermophila]|uniref:hypothetical protein n=1 Tax=Hydrogenimonas thermophila TaxID=223786 RepID=UPI0029371992|nr:hypothetical protein [Hydrogenimonas thermophila]WOE68997.1 hypothetical protein RZR91_07730 [Hydrogenimonas thermophila]WOE71508.1 hypothetical protein RZR97_07710 [Hydrogenimonas thermophila]